MNSLFKSGWFGRLWGKIGRAAHGESKHGRGRKRTCARKYHRARKRRRLMVKASRRRNRGA